MSSTAWLRDLAHSFETWRLARTSRAGTRRRIIGPLAALVEHLETRTLLSAITVDSELDVVDAHDGVTTLREAILTANAKTGHDTIVFNIPETPGRFDAAADFSLAANPNGAWTYGHTSSTGGGFTPFANTSDGAFLNPNFEMWLLPTNNHPFVASNTAATAQQGAGLNLEPGGLGLHPGRNSLGGRRAVVRWTAPATGVYRIDAAFEGRDPDDQGATTDVHILHNGISLLSGRINGGFGPGSGPSLSSTIVVNAGDTIDFAVGNGGNDFASDSTGLDATITRLGSPSYLVTDLGTLGGTSSTANSINESGAVAGSSRLPGSSMEHAFLYEDGVMTDLGSFGGSSNGWAINESGQIAGWSIRPDGAARSFLYSNETLVDIGTLGGTESVAFGLNDFGHVTGNSYTPGDAATHAYLHRDGAMIDLGTLGGNYARGLAVNNAGQVVGWSRFQSGSTVEHGFLYEDGVMRDLGTFGGSSSRAIDINEAGIVTGWARIQSSNNQRAFLYQSGVMTNLGTLGGVYSAGIGINDYGQVTGSAYTPDQVPHAFLYQNGVMIDLNTFVPADSGWTLEEGWDINNRGQIVGNGRYQGQSRAFLLTPEPVAAVIRPTSPLPAITDPVTIDGRTQTGYAGTPLVVLNGQLAGADANGLHLRSDGSEIFGLNIQQFDGSGILIDGADHNWIAGNFIGTDATGTAALGNLGNGVAVGAGSRANRIGTDGDGVADAAERNVISGNAINGIVIFSAGTEQNVVAGNFIGTNADGSQALANGAAGVMMSIGAHSNRIGTDGDGTADQAERNVISGNQRHGVRIVSAGTDGNVVAGNFIGTDASGMAALENGGSGVRIASGPRLSVIGTNGDGVGDAAERNVIAGNSAHGVEVGDSLTEQNVVAGNFIGTDASGVRPLGNGGAGVVIRGARNRVGTNGDGVSDAAERNVIADNGRQGGHEGVVINGIGADWNVVAGNLIGTDVTGTVGLGNAEEGVQISGGGQFNRVGTDGNGIADAAERNVISGNAGSGVFIWGAGTGQNEVAGNFIGTNAAGTAALGNGGRGVVLNVGTNRVGTSGDGVADAAERNLISANGGEGVLIRGAGADRNVVAGNFIGTDVTGTAALGNSRGGVLIDDGAKANLIGTDSDGMADAAERNIISGNSRHGVGVSDSGSTSNVVAGNFIGTDVSGTMAIGNHFHGVIIGGGAQSNRISTDGDGVNDAAERNLISGNVESSGILLQNPGTEGNIVAGNFLGTDVTGTRPLGNGHHGVYIAQGASRNRVGTDADGLADEAERNIISGNMLNGVKLQRRFSNSTADVQVEQNVIAGNYIGTDLTGTNALGNGTNGVEFLWGARLNRIGSDSDGIRDAVEANVIAFNAAAGVWLRDNNGPGDWSEHKTIGNAIQGNAIHSNGGLGIDLGGDGVTANDSLDADDGPNRLQNFPTLQAARPGAQTRVVGTVNSTPDTLLVIEFFANSAADPSGHGEGERFLGSALVLTDAAGNAGFDVVLNAVTSDTEFITATATDPDGNTSEFSAAVAVDVLPPRAVEVGPVTPDPRNAAVSSVRVEFDEAIDFSTVSVDDLQIWLNGVAQILSSSGPLTFTPVGNAAVEIGGLEIFTGADGAYTLSFDATGIADVAGNRGIGSASDAWLMDATAPISRVDSLPRRASSLSFEVSVTGADPSLSGITPSGVVSYDIYASVDGAAFALWTTVAAGSPSATFTAQSNHTYAFRSVARDAAGNVESKPVAVEASIYVPDLDAPVTQVTAVDGSTPTFTIQFSGTDAGGGGLSSIDVFVEVDGGTAQAIGSVNADGESSFTGSVTYQAIADDSTHTYRFYTVGVDGTGNVEAAPSDPGQDVLVTANFAAPEQLEVVGFDVQRGAAQRSYLRYLDVTFNSVNELQALLTNLTDGDEANDRLRLRRFGLSGGGTGDMVDLAAGMFSVNGLVLTIDFGAGGIGGNPSSNVGDGYYQLDLDLDGDGGFESDLNFYRLFGDTNGDRVVDNTDLANVTTAFGSSGSNLDEDVNGDGVVNVLDRRFVSLARGRRLDSGLPLDD